MEELTRWLEQVDGEILRDLEKAAEMRDAAQLYEELGILLDPEDLKLLLTPDHPRLGNGRFVYPGMRVMYWPHPLAAKEYGHVTRVGLLHPYRATHAFVKYDGEHTAKLTPIDKLTFLWHQPGFIYKAFVEEAAMRESQTLEFVCYESIGIGYGNPRALRTAFETEYDLTYDEHQDV